MVTLISAGFEHKLLKATLNATTYFDQCSNDLLNQSLTIIILITADVADVYENLPLED